MGNEAAVCGGKARHQRLSWFQACFRCDDSRTPRVAVKVSLWRFSGRIGQAMGHELPGEMTHPLDRQEDRSHRTGHETGFLDTVAANQEHIFSHANSQVAHAAVGADRQVVVAAQEGVRTAVGADVGDSRLARGVARGAGHRNQFDFQPGFLHCGGIGVARGKKHTRGKLCVRGKHAGNIGNPPAALGKQMAGCFGKGAAQVQMDAIGIRDARRAHAHDRRLRRGPSVEDLSRPAAAVHRQNAVAGPHRHVA